MKFKKMENRKSIMKLYNRKKLRNKKYLKMHKSNYNGMMWSKKKGIRTIIMILKVKKAYTLII